MGNGSLQVVVDQSLRDPDGFWGEAAEAIHWYRNWERVLDDSRRSFYRWFGGGELNTCYNALDLHVEEGRGDQPALIYDSPVTSSVFSTMKIKKLGPFGRITNGCHGSLKEAS